MTYTNSVHHMEFSSLSFWIIIAIFLWLSLVSFFVFRMVSHYNRLTVGGSRTMKDVLDRILDEHLKNRKDIDLLRQTIGQMQKEEQTHMQRVGIVRFNPFSDTGGTQSFTIAFLDGESNGVVMTSLYARTGNRWYIKYVKAGKGEEIELSKEELMAVKQARSINSV